MREVLTVHEPLLVNTLGHSAGTLIFAIFLYLLLRDRAGARLRGSRLTMSAAALACLWNFASLLVIAWPSDLLVTISSSALSLLPAVLLHLSLGGRFRWVQWSGYALSFGTVLIHATEPLFRSEQNHTLALRLTTYGFGLLTLLAVVLMLRSARMLTSRLAGTMSLFLFSLSFVHFGVAETGSWAAELFAHHAGIALALFVLLQDYRFLLLDAFLRFLANILFAGGFMLAMLSLVDVRGVIAQGQLNPFREGMLIVAGCLLLLLFASLRARLDHLLQRLVFRRPNLDPVLQRLREEASGSTDERAFLDSAAAISGRYLEAELVEGGELVQAVTLPCPVSDLTGEDRERLGQAGVEAVMPLQLPASKSRTVFFGRRRGGRRYLSEDFEALTRIQAEILKQMEIFREAELRRLVSQAELRALQSQIHPHFLFNALNTLYGVIPKESAGARRTVLNLSDIFRYFLRSDRAYIPLEEELHIVRAYLEIESMRLGPKLRTDIDVTAEARTVSIPVLTIEPLVENAVKHGVAMKTEGGTVSLKAWVEEGTLRIRVSDTGGGFGPPAAGGAGVGLENVAKRLRLSYGDASALRIESDAQGTRVEFAIPSRSEVLSR